MPAFSWTSVASSADGAVLFAAAPQGIYVSRSTPAPELQIEHFGNDLLLSWIVPSQTLVLKESNDLLAPNWTSVPITPTLNLSELKYEVLVSPTNERTFYRLASP